MKKLISIAVFAVFSASSAMSAGLSPSVGVSLNASAFAGQGTEKNFNEAGTVNDSTTEYGAFAEEFGSVFVELGLSDNFSIGLDHVPGTIESPKNFSREGGVTRDTTTGSNDPGTSSVQVDFEELTTLYFKANVPMLGGTYVKAGIAQVDIKVNENMVSGNTYADKSTDGYVAAIGYNFDLDTMGLSIRTEVMAHTFEAVKTDNGIAVGSGTPANGGRNEITVDEMFGARATISLVKSF